MKQILLILIGISTGLVVGGALAAFIAILNLIERFVQLSKSQKYIKLYEWVFSIGAIVFIYIYFSNTSVRFPSILVSATGLIIGIFIGFFSSALAEVLNVIPLISKKLKIKNELKYVIYSLMLGKVAGSLYFWTIH